MSDLIYYFSGSGNSLKVAKEISKEINGNLIRILKKADEISFNENINSLGLIFPVYHATFGESGIPHIVEDFISKLKNINSVYIYAVCTHSGFPGTTIENLSRLISKRNGTLSVGYYIKMSIPYSTLDKIKHLLFKEELKTNQLFEKKMNKLQEDLNKKIKVIVDDILKRKKAKLETTGRIFNILYTPLYILSKSMAKSYYKKLSNKNFNNFSKLTLYADNSFKTNKKCNGCGICVKVCPVDNISLMNSKPIWHNSCENCFACYQWCPSNALEGEIVQFQRKYHFDDITVKDMIRK